MKYAVILAMALQSFTVFAAEKGKSQTSLPAQSQSQRAPASVTPTPTQSEASVDVDSILGEMQSALEKSDSAVERDANPD